MARNIKKIRDVKKAVLIALEDTKSSRYYFQSLVKDNNLSGKVVFAKHIGTNPAKVLEAIISTPRYNKDYEQRWIVIDKDDWSKKDFNGTFTRARDLGVSVAFSNESYELWVLLHFEKLERYTNRVVLKEKLNLLFKQHFKISYSKADSDIYALIKTRQCQAIINAKALMEKHKRDDETMDPYNHNPLTNIYELIECIENI